MYLSFHDLLNALHQTFQKRNTTLPTQFSIVFSDKVYLDKTKKTQWNAFTRKHQNEYSDLPMEEVIKQIFRFSAPFWSQNDTGPMTWNPDTGWSG